MRPVKDEVEVVWALKNPQPFNRVTVDYITIAPEKDREGWLPRSIGFTVGTGPLGLVFCCSEGIIEEEDAAGLTDSRTLRSTRRARRVGGNL